MTRVLPLVLLSAVLLAGCTGSAGEPVDDRLPDVTLVGFDGGDDVDLGELSGPTVISVWASWCSPCRREMPVLQDFHEAYGDQVPVLGIDYQDQQTDRARELVADTEVTYPLVEDSAGEINGQGAFPPIRGLPLVAFVDGEGHVTHVEAVEIKSVSELVDKVDEHLGVEL